MRRNPITRQRLAVEQVAIRAAQTPGQRRAGYAGSGGGVRAGEVLADGTITLFPIAGEEGTVTTTLINLLPETAIATAGSPLTGTWKSGFGAATIAEIVATLSAAAYDSGDTCDVYVQTSPDNGTTVWNAGHFTQKLGTAAVPLTLRAPLEMADGGGVDQDITAAPAAGTFRKGLLAEYVRVQVIIAGSSGAFTVKVDALAKTSN